MKIAFMNIYGMKFKEIFIYFHYYYPRNRSACYFLLHTFRTVIISCLLLSIWLHFTHLLLTTGGCFCAFDIFMTSSDKATTSDI